MSGETTSATPVRLKPDATAALSAAPEFDDIRWHPASAVPSMIAGAWKHNDLPPPVGSTTTLSRESRIACMASRCSGRKSEKPQTRWSVSSSSRSASGVLVLDVVIDQLLEFCGELVGGAAQRLHMVTVDVHRAARFFAGAGQADADARRLRFAGPVDHTAHDRERHLLDALVGRFPLGHPVADVFLNALGELLERSARRPAAAGTRGDTR